MKELIKNSSNVVIATVVAIGAFAAFKVLFNVEMERTYKNDAMMRATSTLHNVELSVDTSITLATKLLAADSTINCSDIREKHTQFSSRALSASGIDTIARFDSQGKAYCQNDIEDWVMSSAQKASQGTIIHFAKAQNSQTKQTSVAIKVQAPDGAYVLTILAPHALEGMISPQQEWMGQSGALTLGETDTIIANTNLDALQSEDTSQRYLSAHAKSQRYPLQLKAKFRRDALQSHMYNMVLFNNISAYVMAILVFFYMHFMLTNRNRKKSSRELRQGLQSSEFIPFYQPVVNIKTGQIVGAEMLVRRRKKDGSIQSPAMFIDEMERTGLATLMTNALLKQAVIELGPTYKANPQLKLAINLFADHFNDTEIVAEIERIVGPSDIAFSQVVCEVTERTPLPNISRARMVISKLQALGCRVSIDDAGTGHGGLAYIQKLGVDEIKIDKMFVDTIKEDTATVPVIEAMQTLARTQGLNIVAEGVETEIQANFLRKVGIEHVQGFLFAPPLPPSAYLDMIKAFKNMNHNHAPENNDAHEEDVVLV